MAGLKTQPHDGDVDAFIESVEDNHRRRDAGSMMETMAWLSGSEPRMWGTSIVGFGEYQYETGAPLSVTRTA